jgi:8-oxo-dGTP diphosphatase
MKREYPDRPIVGVGAVIMQNGRAVLVKRTGEPLAGEWSVPGGVLEIGESLRQGTEREALEETGLMVVAGRVLDVFDSISADPDGRIRHHYCLVDFLCRLVSGELRAGSDAAAVRWISRNELDTFPMPEPVRGVIRKAFELEPSIEN